eukprot:TRINITY_DN3721_c0_g1::TRINITY_DN3721_c0_g1_i1::g.24111::m.24111 TRINITY_DN3721_c0_g1::TRINITY_DN3721_c0_g1_i1::g.24111  ORF type:complete len:124 (+),score=-18.58,Imm11/PF15563.1/0.012 TRINITY_DN3721_c0_g1_i1:168-539(+)
MQKHDQHSVNFLDLSLLCINLEKRGWPRIQLDGRVLFGVVAVDSVKFCNVSVAESIQVVEKEEHHAGLQEFVWIVNHEIKRSHYSVLFHQVVQMTQREDQLVRNPNFRGNLISVVLLWSVCSK